MAKDSLQVVLRHIKKGTFDEHLDELGKVVWARRKFLWETAAQQLRVTLEVGDRVRLRNGRPKYLMGRTGEVIGLESKGARVRLDDGQVRRYGPELVCPYGMLEKT